MADTHLTIRRQADDPFDPLAEEFGVDVSAAARAACTAVLRSPELLERIREELAVAEFIRRLQRAHPRLTGLRFSAGVSDPNFRWHTRGRGTVEEPIDWAEIDPRIREHRSGWSLDIVDPTTGYGLLAAWHFPNRKEPADCVVPLHALHVPRPLTGPLTSEVNLPDGRRAIESRNADNGQLVHYILTDGEARLVPIDQHVGRAYEVPRVEAT